MDYLIRPIKNEEIGIMEDFLYEAIFQKDKKHPLPRNIVNEPALKKYIQDFGKETDVCLVAEYDNKIIGAVWTRIMNGYGNVDENTPEFAISLYKEYRGKGIGTKLMIHMLKLLKDHGYHKASLAVQKDNYAWRMYQKIGFKIVEENEEEYIMICEFDSERGDLL